MHVSLNVILLALPVLRTRYLEVVEINIVRIATLGTIFLLISSLIGCISTTRRPIYYLIPDGYVGWVGIEYNIADAPELPIVNGHYVVKIEVNGMAQTSTKFEDGVAEDQFLAYQPHDAKLDPARWRRLDSQQFVHGGVVSRLRGSDQITVHYFIGNQDELRKYAWSIRYKDGKPVVGPVYSLDGDER